MNISSIDWRSRYKERKLIAANKNVSNVTIITQHLKAFNYSVHDEHLQIVKSVARFYATPSLISYLFLFLTTLHNSSTVSNITFLSITSYVVGELWLF